MKKSEIYLRIIESVVRDSEMDMSTTLEVLEHLFSELRMHRMLEEHEVADLEEG